MSYDPIPENLMNKIRVMSGCDDVREILNCPHYAVTPDGQVWSVKSFGVSLSLAKIPRRITVRLYKNTSLVKLVNNDRKQVTYSLLKCVALAFIGLPPNVDDWASPIDGDANHISPDNVEWISHSEVMKKSIKRHGGAFVYGEAFSTTKLTAGKVKLMRVDYETGMSQEAIALKYGVTRRTAGRAIRGKDWKQVITSLPTNSNQRRGESQHLAKLTEADVRDIKNRINKGETLSSIARDKHVGVSAIWSIKEGKTWKHVE